MKCVFNSCNNSVCKSGILCRTKILFALLSCLCIGIFSSCSSDEDDELKVESQLLISLKTSSIRIEGMVFVFPDGDYDPKTFKASSQGSIETLSGKKVSSIGTGSYRKMVATVSSIVSLVIIMSLGFISAQAVGAEFQFRLGRVKGNSLEG